MNREQLVAVMLYQLRAFNRTGTTVSESTVHNTVLSNEGPGSATPQRIYKSFVRATFDLNGVPEPSWPPDWPTMTVGDLASRLLSSVGHSEG